MGFSDMDASLLKEEKARKFLKDVMGDNTYKKFLKDVMGDNTYKKFIKDGKIEIKSGKYVYELTIHGTVTNKATT